MLPHEEDLHGLEEYLQALEQVGVTAVICASPAIAMCAKQVAPKLEVHLSTQHSSTNSEAIAYWKGLGIDRVVLARELTLDQIKATTTNSTLPVEVFIHGGMCISYSGRCVLSNHMTGRDANRGGCAQSCRWKYRLYEGDINKPLHNETDLFSMSSKDLMAARYVEDLIHTGVASLKIEGRMKSTYYIATLVHTYRMLIDEIYAQGHIDDKRKEWYCMELAKAENRPTGPGFYQGMPKPQDHLFGVNGAGVTGEFIAYVLAYDEQTKIATLEVRNKFEPHTLVEVFGPHIVPTTIQLEELYDEEGNVLETANKPMSVIKTKIAIRLEKDAMIRKVIEKDRSMIY